MTPLSIQPPYPVITDIDGQPLEDGYIWIGVANLPPIGNPVAVYWDAALTQPAAQPIRTRGGYPVNSGTPARLYVGSDYSIQVQNKNGSVVYSAPDGASDRFSSAQISFLQAGLGAVVRTAQSKMRDVVSVKDFGAVGDGIADDTSAIQAAITANVGPVYFPSGTYLITDTITINTNRPHLIGSGPQKTIIKFNPSSAKSCFNFDQGANSVVQAYIGGFGFMSDNSNNKTAIRIQDGRHCVVEDIGITLNSWAGSGSICLHTLGRDTLSASRFAVLCARPIVIDVNPNFSTLHCDHFYFSDLEIGSTEIAGKAIEIMSGVNISNLTFGGYQAWLLSKYGLYWNDTASSIASYNLRVQNVRTEQASDATGYCVYLASTTQNLQAVSIENFTFDSARNNVYARRALNLSILSSVFTASTGKTLLDITGISGTVVDIENCYVNIGGSVTLTNIKQIKSTNQPFSGSPFPSDATYVYDSGPVLQQQPTTHFEVKKWSFVGDIANGQQLSTPVRSASGMKSAIIAVSGYSATGPISEGGVVLFSPNGATQLSGSVNFAVTLVPGNLCALDAGGGNFDIINNTGQTLRLMIDASYSV